MRDRSDAEFCRAAATVGVWVIGLWWIVVAILGVAVLLIDGMHRPELTYWVTGAVSSAVLGVVIVRGRHVVARVIGTRSLRLTSAALVAFWFGVNQGWHCFVSRPLLVACGGSEFFTSDLSVLLMEFAGSTMVFLVSAVANRGSNSSVGATLTSDCSN